MSTVEKPLVSIITATYNSAATVRDTLGSVSNQTYKNIEHLIIDGLSKDNTLDIVKEFNHPLIVFSGKDAGIYDAMNKGIEKTKGDIIGILNSDDFYADDKVIEKVVKLMVETNSDALYGDLWYVDAAETNIIKRKWVSGKYEKGQFLFGWMPPHPTFFVRKKVYEKYGMFNLNLTSAADYELMLRFLYKNEVKTTYLPELMVKMRVGGKSNSSVRNRVNANMEDRKAWKINDLKPYWFTLYLKPLRKITQFFN